MVELLDYRRSLLARLMEIAGEYQAALRAGERGQALGQAEYVACLHARDALKEIFLPGQERLLAGEAPERLEMHAMESSATPDEPLEVVLAELLSLTHLQASQLADLPPQAWNCAWRHPKAGKRTLLWWVERSLLHLQAHLPRGGSPPTG